MGTVRRDFLRRLARATLFAPPLLRSYDVAAQGPPGLSPTGGGGKGGGKGGGGKSGAVVSEDEAPWRLGPASGSTAPPPGGAAGPGAPWVGPRGSGRGKR